MSAVAAGDPDPRGLPVKAADGAVAGSIVDIWVDRSEPQVRYYRLELGLVREDGRWLTSTLRFVR